MKKTNLWTNFQSLVLQEYFNDIRHMANDLPYMNLLYFMVSALEQAFMYEICAKQALYNNNNNITDPDETLTLVI